MISNLGADGGGDKTEISIPGVYQLSHETQINSLYLLWLLIVSSPYCMRFIYTMENLWLYNMELNF